MRNLLSFNKIALTVAVAGALTLTGCTSKPVTVEDAPAPSSTATSAASATPTTVLQDPIATPDPMNHAVPEEDPWPLHASPSVKAGTDLRVWGETLAPGTTATIHGAEQMGPAVWSEVNQAYIAADEVIITPQITVTADAEGKYDAKLPIPAGTKPQLLNIVLIPSNGGGNLVMTTVE